MTTNKTNPIAKVLQNLAFIEIICGIISGLFLMIVKVVFWVILVEILSSVFIFILLLGFAEVVELLQENSSKQTAILEFLKNNSAEKDASSKTVLEDIESSLPKM